jgi:1,4-alpha-glucan branching enzyme
MLGFSVKEAWKLHLIDDWKGDSAAFGCFPSKDAIAKPGEHGEFPCRGQIEIGPYSVPILSQLLANPNA